MRISVRIVAMVSPVSRNAVEFAACVDVAIVKTLIEVGPIANRRIGAMRPERPILQKLESAVLSVRRKRFHLRCAVDGCGAPDCRETDQDKRSDVKFEVHASARSIQPLWNCYNAIEVSKIVAMIKTRSRVHVTR